MRKSRRKPDITVPSGACITLDRGRFGHIKVEADAELRLGGVAWIERVDMDGGTVTQLRLPANVATASVK